MRLKQGLIVSVLAAFALIVGVLPAVAQTTMRCSDTITGTTVRANITVPAGQSCVLEEATVNGNVTVARSGSLAVLSSTVNGNVVGQDDSFLDVLDSALNGSVRLSSAYGMFLDTSGAAGAVTANFTNNFFEDGFVYLFDADARSTMRVTHGVVYVGDDPDSAEGPGRGSRITGDLTTTDTVYTDIYNSVLYSDVSISGADLGSALCFSEIDGRVSVVGSQPDDEDEEIPTIVQIGTEGDYGCGYNVVAGDLEILDNTADVRVTGNTIRGNLVCEGNTPAPVLGANRLRGEGTGQCASAAEVADAQPEAQARIFSDEDAPAVEERHAEVRAKIAERRAAAGFDAPMAEERAEASENQAEARAADAAAAPEPAPERLEGRALPPRSRG